MPAPLRFVVMVAFGAVAFVSGWLLHLGVSGSGASRVVLAAPAQPACPKPAASVFEAIYREGLWGRNAEGAGTSGNGSTLRTTAQYRAFLVEFLKRENVRSVVDAGCGDWEFSRSIDWSGIDYKGFDIVEAVVASNQRKYAKPNVRFFKADIVEDELPPADLMIVKHVLQHLSNAEISKFLKQLPKYRHVLLVNGVNPVTLSAMNLDIRTGDYRELDPTRPPFDLSGEKILTYWDGLGMHQVVHLRFPELRRD